MKAVIKPRKKPLWRNHTVRLVAGMALSSIVSSAITKAVDVLMVAATLEYTRFVSNSSTVHEATPATRQN